MIEKTICTAFKPTDCNFLLTTGNKNCRFVCHGYQDIKSDPLSILKYNPVEIINEKSFIFNELDFVDICILPCK